MCDSFAQQLHAASTSAADAPTLDHVGSHLDSSWSQLARAQRKLGQAQVGPKWAPVRPNLRPRTAKFDPSRLWLGQVRPLVSSLSNSLGAGGSRREAIRINMVAFAFCMLINIAVCMTWHSKCMQVSSVICIQTNLCDKMAIRRSTPWSHLVHINMAVDAHPLHGF